ncbi:hypothetical protein ACQYRI_12605 [Salmonella enterica]
MSKNWLRHFELQLLDDGGKVLDLGSLKVTFDIGWFNISSKVKVGTFKIYNLSRETISRIIEKKEFSRIRIVAGYEGADDIPVVDESELNKPKEITEAEAKEMSGQNFGLIFSGDIRYAITGKDAPGDSFLLIQAGDSEQAFATSVSAKTLSKGYQLADIYKATMRDFNPYGVTPGLLSDMPETVFPRGKTLLTMTRNVMDNIAAQCKASWQFVDGQLNMVADDEYVHEAVVLNSATGLVGIPQQTIGNGINVSMLINPNIRLNGLIQLDQKFINRPAPASSDRTITHGENTDSTNKQVQPSTIATDGIYIIRGIMYSGDTRGKAWYQVMMCEARE